MKVVSTAFAHLLYIVTRPPLGELGANRLKLLDQLNEMRIASMTAIVGAEPGQRVLGTRRPIDHQGAKLRSGKNQPQHISLV